MEDELRLACRHGLAFLIFGDEAESSLAFCLRVTYIVSRGRVDPTATGYKSRGGIREGAEAERERRAQTSGGRTRPRVFLVEKYLRGSLNRQTGE
jgi:hypothetical protein